jgi:hypothetical protein
MDRNIISINIPNIISIGIMVLLGGAIVNYAVRATKSFIAAKNGGEEM